MVMSIGSTVIQCRDSGRYMQGPKAKAFCIEEWSFVGQSQLVIWAMIMGGRNTVIWCHGFEEYR